MSRRGLILVVALTFLAIAMLMATIQYSSDLISVRSQPENTIASDVNATDLANNTGGPSSKDAGTLQTKSREDVNGLGILPSLSFADQKTGGPSDKPPDPANYLLIVLIILVVLVLLAIIGLIIRRKHKRSQVPENRRMAADPGPRSFEGDYGIRFPQIRAPFPITWGTNEALDLVIERKEGVKDAMVVRIDGNITHEIRPEYDRARVSLELEKGGHRIIVSAKDGADSAGASWVDVRIVDYREEIVRLFNEMYRSYGSGRENIKDEITPRELEQITPRELERALGRDLPEAKRETLGVAVSVFEVANYSLHAVRRRDYEAMYLSRMDVT